MEDHRPGDNTGRQTGKPYPPEQEIDLEASYQGKNDKVKWSAFSTSDPFGMLDVNKQYGEVKEVLAYAYTTFDSDSDQVAQFRIGSKNAWKLWVNGKLLFAGTSTTEERPASINLSSMEP